jgi:hypothetical protein
MAWVNRLVVGCVAIALSCGPGLSVRPPSTLALTSALTSASTPTSASTRPMAAHLRCPARVPKLAAGPSAERLLVPPGATALVDCGYGYARMPSGRTKLSDTGPLQGPLVSGRAVAGYALVLNTQPPAKPAQAACLRHRVTTGHTPRDVLLFGYPGGRTVEVAWDIACYVGRSPFPGTAVGSNGSSASLGPSVTPWLTDLLAVMYGPYAPHVPGSRSRPAPRLVGLSIGAALVMARRHGFTIAVSDEVRDAARPLGTVDLQGPPPEAPASAAAGPLTLAVSVPEAPECRSGQLRGLATSDEPGAGTAFGNIRLRNIGRHPCTLFGPLEVTAAGHLGRPLAVTDRAPVTQPLVLSALSPGPARPARPGTLAATVLLTSTDYAGNCNGAISHPREWKIRLPGGSALLVAAAGPAHAPPVIVCARRVGAGPVTFTGWYRSSVSDGRQDVSSS